MSRKLDQTSWDMSAHSRYWQQQPQKDKRKKKAKETLPSKLCEIHIFNPEKNLTLKNNHPLKNA